MTTRRFTMSTLVIKLIKNSENNQDLRSADEINQALQNIFDGKAPYHTIYFSELTDNEIESILNEYEGTIRKGVSGGCYGARDGKSYEGYTFFAHLKNWDERFLDSDFDEIVNPWTLIEEYSVNGLSPINDESVDEICEAFDSKDENTYNYSGQTNEDARFLTDFHFRVVAKDDECGKQVMFVRFHEGGDIRGNYGEWYVCTFDSIDELYSVIYPSLCIIDVDKLDEIERLKDLISREPADKELLIKELNELLY